MKERKTGNIITISSAAGRIPHPQAPIPYSAAKASIQILTQDVAAQAAWSAPGVTSVVNRITIAF